ncbi:MAG: family 78 glycoside hydrolase catalytic domain [Planctomycetes bacterium]|nr:family 78 glycoside hydrolase catalytic domain [Planctomycetota bacterium]
MTASAPASTGLTGPWWIDDAPFTPTQESPGQEVLFRVAFAGPAQATLRLATSDYYQCWLNGRWLGCGPARAAHGTLTIDTIALDGCGDGNVVAIQVLWEGLFGWDHARGAPGLHLALERDGEPLAFTLLASGRSGRTFSHRFSQQRGWNEDIDHRARAKGWPCGPWQEREWQAPVRRRRDPRVRLEPRDISPLVHQLRRAEQVVFAGSCDPGARTPHRPIYYEKVAGMGDAADGRSASRLIQEEALRPAEAVDVNLAAFTAGGTAELGPDRRGLDRTVQLDFGRETSGLFTFAVEAPAGTVLDLGWSEGHWQRDLMGCWATSGQPDGSVPARELCDARQGLRHVCAGGGVERIEALFTAAFRHLRLAVRLPRGSKARVRIHDLQVRTLGYPVAREGAFRCADADLNRIWDAAVATMENSIADVFMDCPGRERGGWLNDSYWMAIGMQALSADTACERRFLSLLAAPGSTRPYRGMVSPVYPSDSALWRGGGQRAITGHGLFWLLQVERHLRLHGDAALRRAWRPAVEGVIAALARHRNRDGLLESPPWDTYLDWSRYATGAVQTGDNFLYALALERIGRIYRVPAWRSQGRATARAIDAAAWDDGRGLWHDVPGQAATSAVISLVALWSGMAPPQRAERAWAQLRPLHPMTLDRPLFDYETAMARANMVGLMYRFDHAGRIGDTQTLVRDLKEAVLPQLARGQSCIGEHMGHTASLCHGYNGVIAALLARHLAGIELPDDPAGTVRIRPHPEAAAWCQARAPWRGGHVQVWWDRSRLLASLPRGVRGEVALAGGRVRTFRGSVEVGL